MKINLTDLSAKTALYVVGSLIARGAKFLLVPLYVRVLTEREVGVLFIVESLTAALSVVMGLGLASAVSRFYDEFRNETVGDVFVGSIFCVQTIVATALGGGVATAMVYWHGEIFPTVKLVHILLGIFIAVVSGPSELILARFLIREQPIKHRIYRLCEFLTTAGLIVLVVYFGERSVGAVLLAQGVGYSLWFGIGFSIVGRPFLFSGPHDRLRQSLRNWLRRSVRYSLPIMPHRVMQWLISLSDRIIMQWFLPAAAVGRYSVAYSVGAVVLLISGGINNAWLPKFFKHGDAKQGKSEYGRIATYTLLLVTWVVVAVSSVAPELLSVFATDQYTRAAGVLRVIVVAFLAQTVYRIFVNPAFYAEATSRLPVATGMAATANVLLNLWLVPVFGPIVAAWSTLVSYIVMAAGVYVVVSHGYEVKYEWKKGAVIVVLGLVGVIAVSLIRIEGTIATIARTSVIVLYPALVWTIPGLLEKEEKQFVRKLVG